VRKRLGRFSGRFGFREAIERVCDRADEFDDALAGRGRNCVEFEAALGGEIAKLVEVDAIRCGVKLGGCDDHRLFGEIGAKSGEFALDDFEILHGIARVRIARVDQMDDEARAFEMLEKARAEAGAFMGAFDQTGNVGDHESATHAGRGVRIGRDDAEVRFESGERIRGDFWTRGGDSRNQRGFSRVREADEADVSKETKFEAKVAFLAGPAGFVFARRLVPRLDERRVAITTTTAPAASGEEALAGLREVEELLTGVGVEDDGADGYGEDRWNARAAVAIGPFAVASALGLEFTIVTIAKKRVVVRVGLDVDVATIATVATRRAAARDIFFATEGHAAVATIAGLHDNFCFISEHGTRRCGAKRKRGPSLRSG
jgi:hypothetical protein